MSEGYHPEVDDSLLCTEDYSAKHRSIIGCCIWIIVFGRFDMSYATSAMSRFNMLPREGHLKAVKRILSYLKIVAKGRLIIDTSYPDHFDADHVHDLVTRRSITVILAMLNNTPIRLISKHQKTVETPTYGSELVASRVSKELIFEIRYMLRSLGVALDGVALMLGDNMSVVFNTTVPSSVLKKKHIVITNLRVREAIAARIMRFAYIKSEENVSDVLTKPLSNEKFQYLMKRWLFRVPEKDK
jgi:hypothetical protein